MDKINKLLLLIVTVFIFSVGIYKPVYAYLWNNESKIYVDDNYNVITEFYTASSGQGTLRYKVTADLSDVDEVYIPHALAVERCCDAPYFEVPNSISVIINGKTIYTDTDSRQVDSASNLSPIERALSTVNIKSFRSTNSQIEYFIQCSTRKCLNCGAYPYTQFMSEGLKFYDIRAVATNIPNEQNIDVYGSAKFGYTFSSNTSRVAWAIRYNGDSDFTLLSEGTNRDGLIATSVNSKVMILSNVPPSMDGCCIGAFVYDEHGNLPGGTSLQNTPFYTKINVSDNDSPLVEIKKTIDSSSKSVIVEVIASDNTGLHETPYSFDGGNTYEASNKKSFDSPGIYTIVVRDLSGNETRKNVAIDAIEIERANPKTPENEPVLKEKETDTGKGGADNKPAEETNKGKPVITTGTADGSESIRKEFINGTPYPSALDKAKEKDKEYTKEDTKVNDSLKNIDEVKSTIEVTSISKENKDKSKNTSLNAKKIPEKDSNDVFDQIRQNSENYIISMRETKNEESKGADKDEAKIELKQIDEDDGNIETYSNENSADDDAYVPKVQDHSLVALIVILTGIILLMAVLLVFLFFGAIVFAKKETEYSMLSGSDGIRVPVALLFVCFKDGERSICFGELLNKYDVCYVKFGLLFSYMYENEKISIMTRFKGENKREIAKEIIKKEIIVGKKGGKRK